MAIDSIWESFGSRLWEVALANRDFFEKQMGPGRGAMFYDAGWEGLREKFKQAVEGRVHDNLAKNREYVLNEMRGLGLIDRAGTGTVNERTEEDRGLREMQVKAEYVAKAQEGMAKTRHIPVGEKAVVYDTGPDAFTQIETFYFDPDEPPDYQVMKGEDSKDWATIKREYDKLDMFVKQAMAESPRCSRSSRTRPSPRRSLPARTRRAHAPSCGRCSKPSSRRSTRRRASSGTTSTTGR